jgi:alkaline phosphatase
MQVIGSSRPEAAGASAEMAAAKPTLWSWRSSRLIANLAPGYASISPAKNVILMVTDGASWGTWDMASYWEYGALGQQPYDSFPVKLGMTTTPLNTSNTPTGTGIPQVSYDPAKAWDTTPNAGTANHFNGYDYIKRRLHRLRRRRHRAGDRPEDLQQRHQLRQLRPAAGLPSPSRQGPARPPASISSVPFSHATPAAFGAQNISRNNYRRDQPTDDGRRSLDLIMGGGNP